MKNRLTAPNLFRMVAMFVTSPRAMFISMRAHYRRESVRRKLEAERRDRILNPAKYRPGT